MLKDIITNSTSISIKNNTQQIKIPNIRQLLDDFFTGSYTSLSFAPTPMIIEEQMKKGIWLDINFDTKQNYKEYDFTKLSFNLKPKYNWVTIYVWGNNKYYVKPITVNLSTPTTYLYKHIIKLLKDIVWQTIG